MQPEVLYFAATAASLAFVVMAGLEAILRLQERLGRQVRERRRRRSLLASLPEVVQRVAAEGRGGRLRWWDDYVGPRIAAAGWSVRPAALLGATVGLAAFGTGLALWLSRDIFVAAASAVAVFLVPLSYLNLAVQKHEQRILEQLPVAIQLFAVEFEAAKSVREAMLKASEGVDNPLRQYMRRCAYDLAAGRHPGETMRRFARSLGCSYGRLWARLLLAATHDATVVRLMPRLTERLSGQRLLMEKNLVGLAGERRIGLILNFLVLPGLVFTRVAFPDSVGFFSTPLGRLCIINIFLSVVVGIALDQLLQRVEF